jgi:hypothetical protein
LRTKRDSSPLQPNPDESPHSTALALACRSKQLSPRSNDTVNVEGTVAGVPATVDLGDGADTVNLSPVARKLSTSLEWSASTAARAALC